MTRTFKLKPYTVHEKFSDESVILNLESGSYYSAQDVASVVWQLVCDGASEGDILQSIKAEFVGDSDEISLATAKFLDQLVHEELVEVDCGSDSGGKAFANANGAPDKAFCAPILEKYTDMEEMLLLDPIHEVDEHGWPIDRRQTSA